MKPTLQLKLSHQLKLTPKLQQSIRLLQLSTIELNEEIERIVQENPLLELQEASFDSVNDDSSDSSSENHNDLESENEALRTDNSEDSAPFEEEYANKEEAQQDEFITHSAFENSDFDGPQIAASPITLREHLLAQVACSKKITEFTKKIASLLIDSLDDDGYLTQSLDELHAFLQTELDINRDDLVIALKHIQKLDPSGVGAQDLQECLALQLQSMPEKTLYRNEAHAIISNYLHIWAAHDYGQIKKILGYDDKTLQGVQKLITQLNPKPGEQFSASIERYVIPDIIVRRKNGAWIAELNNAALPRLTIHHLYANILNQTQSGSENGLSGQLTEAKWIIRNVQQRAQTILNVATAIVTRQQQFFEHGEVAMRPLVLREIAEVLNLHESTVSRVTTQKFMHTPRGIFELKYFFGSHLATDTGGACSATAIRALIKELIQQENAKKPLSDSKIATILTQQGIIVARRTIAKYREILQIPPANLRKSF